MKFKKLLGVILSCIMVFTMLPATAFAAEQSDNTITDEGYLKHNTSITYKIEVKEKSNLVIQFNKYNCSGYYTLKVFDNEKKVIYKNPGYEGSQGKMYEVGFLMDHPQHHVVLKKGNYKVVLKAANPWTPVGVDYDLKIKWAPVYEVMEELIQPEKPILNVISVGDTGKIKLKWNECDGADGYIVLRKKGNSSPECLSEWRETGPGYMFLHEEIQETVFIDQTAKEGVKYRYCVVAVNSKNFTCNERFGGTWSDFVIKTCDLARPTGLKATTLSSTGKVKLTWDAVSKADGYKVYRATSENGKYYLQKTVTGTSYTNKSAKPGKTYYYKIKAVMDNKSAATSAYSAKVSKLCRLGRPAVKASNVAKTGKIKLTWAKIEGADKYEIYRSTSKNGTYKKIFTTAKTSFINTGAEAEKLYYYKVKAIDNDKAAANSVYSVKVNRTCDLARPVVTSSKDKATKKVKLTWKTVEGAEKYEVYRATSKNGKYSKMGTTKKTEYVNKSAKKGKTYYYKVRAISDKSSANSAYSLKVTGKASK